MPCLHVQGHNSTASLDSLFQCLTALSVKPFLTQYPEVNESNAFFSSHCRPVCHKVSNTKARTAVCWGYHGVTPLYVDKTSHATAYLHCSKAVGVEADARASDAQKHSRTPGSPRFDSYVLHSPGYDTKSLQDPLYRDELVPARRGPHGEGGHGGQRPEAGRGRLCGTG